MSVWDWDGDGDEDYDDFQYYIDSVDFDDTTQYRGGDNNDDDDDDDADSTYYGGDPYIEKYGCSYYVYHQLPIEDQVRLQVMTKEQINRYWEERNKEIRRKDIRFTILATIGVFLVAALLSIGCTPIVGAGLFFWWLMYMLPKLWSDN